MKYQIIPVTHYQQNCSLIWCEQTASAAFVDPGGDVDHLLSVIEGMDLTLTKIILTHGHMDHVGGAAQLAAHFEVPIEGPHRADEFWLDGLRDQAVMMGFPQVEPFKPNRWLEGGDRVEVGEQTLEVLHCPGHTPGHVVLVHRAQKLAFVGDVLFAGSVGRTDFPRGNTQQLLQSIREKLFPLGDDVKFVPGHGPMSTFGVERNTNPFVADERYG